MLNNITPLTTVSVVVIDVNVVVIAVDNSAVIL